MANEADLLEPVDTTTEAPEPQESLRDTLEAAFDESEEATPELPKQAGEPAAKPAVEGQPAATPEGREQVKPVVSPQEKGSTPGELKAPAQWKPEVREQWNKLPRAVQEEVLRREGDNLRLIGSVGPKIRLADQVASHVTPFVEQLQQTGVSPSSFIDDVFASVKTLSHGSPQQKVETVANIVQSYGVDLRLLDQVLSNRLQVGPEAFEARRQAARAQAKVQQYEQRAEQQGATEAEKALIAFQADPKHEFLDDVRDLMADLIEADRAESLEDAYAAAVWAHPDTRKILLERQQQQRVTNKSARAAAARRASSAVHGSPANSAGAVARPGASLRDTLEAAFDEHTNL